MAIFGGRYFAKRFSGSVWHWACSSSARSTPKTSALSPKSCGFFCRGLLLGQGGMWWDGCGGRDEFLEELEGCAGQGLSLLHLFPTDQRAARNPKRRKRRRKRRNTRRRRRRTSITRRMLPRHPLILLRTGMRGSWVWMKAVSIIAGKWDEGFRRATRL